MLMTEYQRERHKRLSQKHRQKKVNLLKKPGRPREFKGHVPMDRPVAGQEGTVQSIHDRRADVG